jgi:hypothetical protein
MSDLPALLSDPAAVLRLTDDERKDLRVRLAALAAALDACEPSASSSATTQPPVAEDELLTADEVAVLLKRTREWVYRKAATLKWRSFVVREGRTLRFLKAGLLRHLARAGPR